jgi:hypothetical protein
VSDLVPRVGEVSVIGLWCGPQPGQGVM